MIHPVQALFAELPSVEPFPDGVVRVPSCIPGTAFFPGGAGLWDTDADRPLPPMPMNGVMVLGQDFHSKSGYEQSLRLGGEVRIDTRGLAKAHVRTWANLLPTLHQFHIPVQRCFFTNIYMGLRDSDESTGKFPGSTDQPFVARCREFFLKQLEAQQPKLILSLGGYVPVFLAPLAEELAGWKGVRTFQDIDQANPVRHEVRFKTPSSSACSIVCLTHPSLRGPNVWRRRYDTLTGHPSELAMIEEGISRSGVNLHVV